ncbi:hypothetical protein J4Q44_G00392570, partial [Coregonus suidteri]
MSFSAQQNDCCLEVSCTMYIGNVSNLSLSVGILSFFPIFIMIVIRPKLKFKRNYLCNLLVF